VTRMSTANGVFWSVVDSGSGQALSFAIFLILARIITPEEYGTFALAGSFTCFGFYIMQGLAPAVLQRGSIGEEHTSTAFWTSLAIGAVFAAVMAASAGWLAALFQNPLLAPVLRWMSLVCLPMALASIPMALFRRDLRMSAFALRTVTGYAVGGAVSISLAMNGFGVLALAFGQIAQWVTTVVVIYAASSWRPKCRFSLPIFFELGQYSAHYIAAMAVGFVTSKMDMWILALFLDVKSLGYYALALRLLDAVGAATILPIDRLVLPLLSPLRSAPAEFHAQYRRLVIGATSAWLPAVAGIGVLSAMMIPIAFGNKWMGSIPVVQAMCISAFTYSLTAFTGEALSASGRPDVFSKLEILRLAATTVVFAIAAPLGIVAAGLAWSILPMGVLPFHLIALRRASGFAPARLLAEWSKVAASGAVMAAAILIVDRFGPFGWWVPAVEITMGAAIYALVLDRIMLPGCIIRHVRGLGSMPAFASQVKRS
jgi:O-antigen/teichoic acid export membrane protein